ncbi:MAG TPA: folate-binding protein [Alphaproteobacteria bacterium]
MTDRSYLVLEDRGVLTVTGEDRRPFLQGLISNDIEKVAADRAIYASLLTAQGRFLHDFFIAALDDVFLLDAEGARIDDLRRRLSLYRLRAKVTLTAAPDRAVVALFGNGALSALGLQEDPGQATRLADGVAFVDPRLMRLGARAIVPRTTVDRLATMGFSPGSRADYEALRFALGVPDGSRDLPIEKALLLENGFDELNGIDWKKGCYVGQELTARMKYRSLVRKRLMPVRIEGETPPPGTPILLDQEEAGEMRSASADRGLAMLRLEMVERADREGRQLTAGNASLTPLKPAWAAS